MFSICVGLVFVSKHVEPKNTCMRRELRLLLRLQYLNYTFADPYITIFYYNYRSICYFMYHLMKQKSFRSLLLSVKA